MAAFDQGNRPMMRSEELGLLRDLLTGQRMLSLGVLIDSKPYVGLLPFVTRPDFGALVIHASNLARHTRGLVSGAAFGALIHATDRPDADPLQLPRLSLEGSVQRISRDEVEWVASRDVYLEKYPSSRSIFQLGDFHLYELAIESGRLIAGFGSIHTLNRRTLAEAAAGGTGDTETPT
jgi:putative heme iron utilization protein